MGATYTNTQSKTIFVQIAGQLQGISQCCNYLNVNGQRVGVMVQNTAGLNIGTWQTLTAWVPPGGTYSYTGNGTIVSWFEFY